MADDSDTSMADIASLDSNNETIDVQENDLTRDVNRKSRRSRNSRKRANRRLRKQQEAAQVLKDNIASLESDTEPAKSSAKEPTPNVSMSSAPAPSAPLVRASDSQLSNTNVLPSNTNVNVNSRPAVPSLFTPQLLEAIRNLSPNHLRPLLSDEKAVVEALERIATPRTGPQCPRIVRGKQCGDPFEVRGGETRPYCSLHMKSREEYEAKLRMEERRERIRAQILLRPEIAELARVNQEEEEKADMYMEAREILTEQKMALKKRKHIEIEAKHVTQLEKTVKNLLAKTTDNLQDADEVCERLRKKPRLFD